MTSRSFFYLFVVGLAGAVTAATGSSELMAESPTTAMLGAVDSAGSAAANDSSSRWVLLVAGIGLVLMTYRQAYLNFRR